VSISPIVPVDYELENFTRSVTDVPSTSTSRNWSTAGVVKEVPLDDSDRRPGYQRENPAVHGRRESRKPGATMSRSPTTEKESLV
jgi:hypothetical protein